MAGWTGMALHGDAGRGDAAGSAAQALEASRRGDEVHFRQPLEVAGRSFARATVLREYGPRTGRHTRLLRMSPGGDLFICKFKDLRREHALMSTLRQMNRWWSERGISVLGVPVEAVTYGIRPLSERLGLVEAVPESWTLCELARGCAAGERHLRVLRALSADPGRLDRLAASTTAYLTMGYALGIRDGHDDNLMLRSDGAFFRVDFEFAFGRTPEVDAPALFVPRAVAHALGRQRWAAVVEACGRALQALSSDGVRTLGFSCMATDRPVALQGDGQLPAWDCLRSVPEMGPLLAEARAYSRTLSFEAFGEALRWADQWSLSRTAKNTIREAVRYLSEGTEDWRGALEALDSALGLGPAKQARTAAGVA